MFVPQVPDRPVYVEPYQRRVRATVGDATVIDSEAVVLVHRPGSPPVYGFPAGDVTGVGADALPELAGYVTVAWSAVDGWFEEDQPVFLHARNPYHRVDCLPTQRRLRVTLAGAVLVDTTDTVVLYETSLPPRLYVHPRHVRPGVLAPSETTTHCPYKGTTTYWSATVDDTEVADVAWSYDDPLPECPAIRGLLSFEDARVTVETDLPAPVELHD